MNILITGATGLIGSALCKQLSKNHTLHVLTRNPQKAKRQLGNSLSYFNSLHEINFNTIDCVINLAGEAIVNKRWSKKQKQRIRDSRIILTQQITAAIIACETPPHTFISGSAIGYYGRQGSQSIDETYQKIHPEFSHTLCDDWEQGALKAHSPRTRVCVLRTGIVLANHGGALAKMLPPFKLGLGGPIASGAQGMSWIHIDDMVALIEFSMLNQQLTGAINATAPIPQSNRDFSKTLAKALHRPAILPMPAWVLNILMGEMAELVVFGQYVLPQKIIDAGFVFAYPTLPKALDNLLSH
ncbi:TIGR01777 family oxidoreductase [Pseudoalteromonas shioyasakiensis]|uniref:TIGR01777 family oxidoreductase n=1 Tax=Pseudoalteromonas shioyasakiensis TaxID=1190813 RepID=UPI0021187A56|nr:TIGR01777 family oxidoreductase [Pseudoalteromonas shioyasakiensis]MCQ8877014.1 TIGR01777 family oxidoreductase [Pseudoalteromonas shioyasakiensis]